MDSGDPGAPGVSVLRPVDMEEWTGTENVSLPLQLMEERPVLVIEGSLRDVTRILVL